MKNFYLLTFNEDWADEHNVPAIACFTEKEYKDWCEAPTGVPNKEYKKELAEFNDAVAAYRKDPKNNRYINSIHDKPRKFSSGISAYLGNNGDRFGESFEDYPTGQALIKGKVVRVFEVDSSFHKIFHKANLSSLSLSNVFDGDLAGNYDYESDEE